MTLLTADIKKGEMCEMTGNRESYLSTNRLGNKLLPLLTDDMETGELCCDTTNRESYRNNGMLGN